MAQVNTLARAAGHSLAISLNENGEAVGKFLDVAQGGTEIATHGTYGWASGVSIARGVESIDLYARISLLTAGNGAAIVIDLAGLFAQMGISGDDPAVILAQEPGQIIGRAAGLLGGAPVGNLAIAPFGDDLSGHATSTVTIVHADGSSFTTPIEFDDRLEIYMHFLASTD